MPKGLRPTAPAAPASAAAGRLSDRSRRPLPPAPAAPAARPKLLAGVALLALALLAHLPVLSGGFLWDDRELILDHPALSEGRLGAAWSGEWGVEYVPLTLSLHWLGAVVHGGTPLGFRVPHLALHLLAALLLWRLLAQLRMPGAWLGAALWASHPVTVATTGWIAETKNTLCQVLALAAACLWLAARDAAPDACARRRVGQVLATLAFAAACLAKPTLVALPLALPLLLWWRDGARDGAGADGTPRQRWRTVAGHFASLSGWLVAAAAVAAITVAVQHGRAMGEGLLGATPLLERGLLAARALLHYLHQAFWPAGLTVISPRWTAPADALSSWLPLLVLLAFAVAAAVVLRRARRAALRRAARAALVAGTVFALLLAPALGLVPKSYDAIAAVSDHFAYAALAVPCAVAAAVGTRALRRAAAGDGRPTRFRVDAGSLLAAVVLAVLVVLSHQRAQLYENQVTLFADNVARHPEAWLARNNLGAALLARGEIAAAEEHLLAAAALHPGYVEPRSNLALLYLDEGRLDEAAAVLEEAAALAPETHAVRVAGARLALARGTPGQAAPLLDAALAARPRNAELLNLRGVTAALLGESELAESHFRAAAALPEARANLGRLLESAGRRDEARAAWQSVLALRSDDAAARAALERLARD